MSGNNMGLECSLRRRTDHWRITGQIHGGIFGYGILLKCRPRVPHDTLGEQLRHETSPEGVGQYPWGTIKVKNVAQGCHTTRLGNDKGMKCRPRVPYDTPGEQLRHETSPEGAARHARVTFWGWNVALALGRGQRLRLATSKCTLLPKQWKVGRWWSRRSGRGRR